MLWEYTICTARAPEAVFTVSVRATRQAHPELDRIAAAWRLLDELGVTFAELQRAEAARRMVPTVGAYLPLVRAAAGSGANRAYGSYWDRMAAAWGDRRLNEITASEIEAMQRTTAATARSRRTSRHGRCAGEHVIAAARALFNRAIADNLIDPAASPAHRVAKPRRLPSTRRALTTHELTDINLATRTSGNDPSSTPSSCASTLGGSRPAALPGATMGEGQHAALAAH